MTALASSADEIAAPTALTVDYMVLVGMKQWRKVAEAVAADPTDKVIIEGYPTVQPEFAGITVHAMSATTTGIQAGKRAAQQAGLGHSLPFDASLDIDYLFNILWHVRPSRVQLKGEYII